MLRSTACLLGLASLLWWCRGAIAEVGFSPGNYFVPAIPDVVELGADTSGLEETAWIKLGPNSETWLPPMIESLGTQRPGHEAEVVALIEGLEGERYLVTHWVQRTWDENYVDFHKVLVGRDGRPRLKFLRRIGTEDRIAAIVKPTGPFSSISDAPVIVVFLCSCGSDFRGHRLLLIRLRRNTIDITPDSLGRVTDIVDLDGDGGSEVAAMDDRWAGMYDTRGAAGPRLPVILSSADGRLRPACREHAEVFRRTLRSNDAQSRGDPYDCTRAELVAENLLIYAQLGDFESALGKLSELDALLEPTGERCFTTATATAAIFRDVIESARDAVTKDPSAQCLVSAGDFRGAHAGAEGRTRHFESLATHD